MIKNYWWLIFIGLVITLIGLLTQKYFFLLLFLPISYFYKNKDKES